jgi:hypothetical protein
MKYARFAIAVLLALGAFLPAAVPAEAPRKLLLLGQKPDGHPKTMHEYMAGARIMAKLLEKTRGLEVRIEQADEPWTDGPKSVADADGAVLFLSQGAKWLNSDPRRVQAFAKLAARGGGLICLHWAMGTREAENIEPFVRLFGGCHGGPDRKYKILEVEAQPADHPIAHGVKPFRVREEFYYRLNLPRLTMPTRLRRSFALRSTTTWRRWPGPGNAPTEADRSASAGCTITTTGSCRSIAGWWYRVSCGA